jgi:hypothetical protein
MGTSWLVGPIPGLSTHTSHVPTSSAPLPHLYTLKQNQGAWSSWKKQSGQVFPLLLGSIFLEHHFSPTLEKQYKLRFGANRLSLVGGSQVGEGRWPSSSASVPCGSLPGWGAKRCLQLSQGNVISLE